MRAKLEYAPVMLLCCVSLVSLIACGREEGGSFTGPNPQNMFEENGSNSRDFLQNPLLGTWVNREYKLTFKSDNTYEIDFTRDGSSGAWGSITLSGNAIILTDSGGRYSCMPSAAGEVGSGCYTYTMIGNTLTFSLFHDACSSRTAILGLTYTKQKLITGDQRLE